MMMINSYQDRYDLHRPPYLSLPCFAPLKIMMKFMLVRLKVMMLMVRMVVATEEEEYLSIVMANTPPLFQAPGSC